MQPKLVHRTEAIDSITLRFPIGTRVHMADAALHVRRVPLCPRNGPYALPVLERRFVAFTNHM